MSRLQSKTLIPHVRFFLRRFHEPTITTAPPSLFCFSRRLFSSKPQLIRIDLDSATSKTEAEAEIKKLNEFVRRIIVHNWTPDWLPFAPGSSFWVPPHKITVMKIANKVTNPLNDEESLSLSSPFGWPCSSFFIPSPSDDSSSTSTQEEEQATLGLKNPRNERLEVKLAHHPDPIYSFKTEDGAEGSDDTFYSTRESRPLGPSKIHPPNLIVFPIISNHG